MERALQGRYLTKIAPMMIYESYAPRRRGRAARLLRLLFYAAIVGLGVAAYFYGPGLYYRFLGDSLFRVQSSNRQLGQKLQRREGKAAQIYEKIQENRRITSILLKNKPANPEILIEQALLNYLELLLGMPLDAQNLLELTGRGFLPSLRNLPSQKKPLSSTRLALRISKALRKALAIKPDLSESTEVLAMLLFSDFIYTGRMDPMLLQRAGGIDFAQIPSHLRASSEWLLLALYTLSANTKKQQELLDFLDASGQKEDLQISSIEKELLRCHALYFAKRYYRAWQIARRIKQDKLAPLPYRVEAARMLAEIFLVQRGKASALYYLKEALALSNGEEPFIRDRIRKLEQN